jgi:hypothetical protein
MKSPGSERKLTWSCVTTLFVIFLERKQSVAAPMLDSPFLGVVVAAASSVLATAADWLLQWRCSCRTKRSTCTVALDSQEKKDTTD